MQGTVFLGVIGSWKILDIINLLLKVSSVKSILEWWKTLSFLLEATRAGLFPEWRQLRVMIIVDEKEKKRKEKRHAYPKPKGFCFWFIVNAYQCFYGHHWATEFKLEFLWLPVCMRPWKSHLVYSCLQNFDNIKRKFLTIEECCKKLKV